MPKENPMKVVSSAFDTMLETELQELADLIEKRSGVSCDIMISGGGPEMEILMYKKSDISKEMYDTQVELAAFVFENEVARRERICELRGKYILAEVLADPEHYEFDMVWEMVHTKSLYLLDYEWLSEEVPPLEV